MLSFVVAGVVNWSVLRWTLQRWSAEIADVEPYLRRVQESLWLYSVPLPWLLWVHAQSPQGTSWEALKGAVLVRDHLHWTSQGSELWLNGLFLSLALLETMLVLWTVHRACASWRRTVLVLSTTAAGTLVALCGAAQFVFWLRG